MCVLLLLCGCTIGDRRHFSINGVQVTVDQGSTQLLATNGGASGDPGPRSLLGDIALSAFLVVGVVVMYGIPLLLVHEIVD